MKLENFATSPTRTEPVRVVTAHYGQLSLSFSTDPLASRIYATASTSKGRMLPFMCFYLESNKPWHEDMWTDEEMAWSSPALTEPTLPFKTAYEAYLAVIKHVLGE